MMIIFVLIACALFIGVRWANSRSQPPSELGVTDGRLAACPDRPNCVSSQADDPEHEMTALPLDQPAKAALDRLEEILAAMPRAQVVSRNDRYLHAEFRSRLFGFVDDVEFAVDPTRRVIDFRSASRVGYSDLGANRKRMEEISRRFRSQ